ncbi:BrnT family toxin [Caulobacter vibrioides]|uniref:BrnT family toxin n=2 Tax=Caulobacter vibrioides TaxID=155892 RepID=Q9AAV4_CAUVC|nr:BrnT family toxin [Caulobacter vibrioides]YP_002515895.1 BrnT-related ribonuclease toxin [Caulobacter vibrioides NA1000]AAK22476.1 conserved hypothetical protein [Caulobacter vibrioides CB15]ACL93987.1 BrnT-related ribonuclease toxin [Caulobacter vibrioides NA1000]ATC27338.1 hypothetical protein CA607_02640 [Caulobacter vibrioides]AZH11718.1 BrnT family toxin [Caulobacter vibrioides]QXZ52578.1 BrnT family toxin [Caulobacter vibrioides]
MLLAEDFDWDDGNREKCQKHGVSIAEIEAVLLGDPLVAPDLAHSDVEDRRIAVGKTPEGRAMFIAFTLRTKDGKLHLRPVSARYMHAKEARRYDQSRS